MPRILVLHSAYGCDTGCCGHVIEIDEPDGVTQGDFHFEHPYGRDPRAFAEQLVRDEFGEEHVKDLDWEHSTVLDDQ